MAWPRADALVSGDARTERSLGASAGAYLGLLKSRVVGLLLVVALVTATVSAGGRPKAGMLLLLALSGGLAASGAAALNHYLDRDIDARMRRTQGRPLPSGRIAQPRAALALGLALLTLGLLFSLPLGLLTTLFLALGAAIYIFIYTLWLKRSHPLNIVIGGGAGSCAAL
ncbi:MAG: UbiA family prenyltransferase, partial [Chloroflexi bacterium]|nr:UbiA family prenyltransferase [Chloroflexota bacterium]